MRSSPPVVRALACALLCACASTPPAAPPAAPAPPPPPAPLRITVVGTNDIHGWVMPQQTTLKNGTQLEQGGLALLAGYVKALEAENPGGVLLLDGGDMFQGTLASNLTEGALVIDAMNALGFEASALGNHEFDFGPVGPVSVAREGDDPFGALKARIQQAKFAVLGANVTDAATGKIPDWLGNDGTRLVERNGVRIGILGLATPHTPKVTNPVNVASLRFHDMVPATLAAAQALRAKGAEVVVAVAHAGAVCKRLEDPRDLSSCASGDREIFDLVEALPEGTLDAVVAGHTHQPIGHFVKGTPVIETPGRARHLGVVEVLVDPTTRKVLRERTKLEAVVPLCPRVDKALGSCEERVLRNAATVELVPARYRGREVAPEPGVKALLDEALAKVEAEQNRPLGVRVPEKLARDYERESALGNALTDALRAVAKADLAVWNSGGLRADLRAGDLTYGAVFEVLPFDNTVATVTLTGAQVRALLEGAAARKSALQVSGVKLTLSNCKGAGQLLDATLPDGRPLKKDRRYRVAMPDFLASGGAGFDEVLKGVDKANIDLGLQNPLSLRDAVIQHWVAQKKPIVAPKPGRVVRKEPRGGCPKDAAPTEH